MPKILCKCNYVIDLGGIPSRNQFLIISDVDFDKFQKQVDPEDVYSEMQVVAKCPNCGRLHIFWDGFNSPQSIYRLD